MYVSAIFFNGSLLRKNKQEKTPAQLNSVWNAIYFHIDNSYTNSLQFPSLMQLPIYGFHYTLH